MASQLPWSHLTDGSPFSWSMRGKSNACVRVRFSAYRLRLLHHDLNANFGLLVLVNQAHQLLSVLRPHQHHWTRKGVCFPQLCERDAQKTNNECVVFFSPFAVFWFLQFAIFWYISIYILECFLRMWHSHLGGSIGIITDIKYHSLSSLIQCHASLKEETRERQELKTKHTAPNWDISRKFFY